MLAMEGEEQQAEIDRLAGDNENRKSLMNCERCLCSQRNGPLRSSSARSIENEAPAEEVDAKVAEIAASSIQLDMTRDELLSTVLVADDLQAALDRPNQDKRAVLDDDNDEPYLIDSPRKKAIKAAQRSRHPNEHATIDAVIAKYDTYRDERNTLDDPSDLVRLLQGSGVLEFRIAPGIGDHVEEAVAPPASS